MKLNEDIELLRETTRRFAEESIAPRAASIDASNEFPQELWTTLGEMGLLGHHDSGVIRGLRDGLPGAPCGHGGDFARVGFGGSVLRRAFQPVSRTTFTATATTSSASASCRN